MTDKDQDIFDYNNLSSVSRPLAERCRPLSLADVIGHKNLIGPGSMLRRHIRSKFLPSIILWGPPGVGKTTLARVLAAEIDAKLESISAVSSGIKEVKQIIQEAAKLLKYNQQKTILFIDEIHRFNKAQQDALLHAVENGTITLIGATTENPSFEVISPLLSRCQVFQLEELTSDDLDRIIDRAIKSDVILSKYSFKLNCRDALKYYSGGDARRMLNLLELAFNLVDKQKEEIEIDESLIKQVLDQKKLYYDKNGEYHYDVISAFIKSVRGSDPDAAVYWLARMLDAGEDPVFIARRLIVLAAEDVGNAEPYALTLANAGFDAVKNIGMPEARIVLAQVVTYLASVPKSNSAYLAIEEAMNEIKSGSMQAVPKHLRNAPTKLMKELKYGAGYKYPHDFSGHFVRQDYLPDNLKDKEFYLPGMLGREIKLKQYLNEHWPKRKGKAIDR